VIPDVGDARVFSRLFTQHAGPLTRLVARMVSSQHVAAELVQDVFLGLWSSRSQLEIRADLASYLRRAARNRALDWLRREELHRQWEQLEARDSPGWSADVNGSDHEQLARMRDALAKTLDAMPPRRRAVCELRWREGLGPATIARRLDVSLKTVETHVTRGLKDVRRYFRLSASPT
jgi:RNA polymerase sigma-70 factor (ECF subfamily)